MTKEPPETAPKGGRRLPPRRHKPKTPYPFVAKLLRITEAKGMNGQMVAQHLGVSQSMVSKWTRDRRTITPYQVRDWCQLLGVSVDSALDDDRFDAEDLKYEAKNLRLTESEITVVDMVRRMGIQEAMRRLLDIPAGR